MRAAREAGASLAWQGGGAPPGGTRADVDVAFDCAGDADAVEAAVEVVRPGGRVVLVGIPGDDRTTFRASVARRKGLTLILCRRSTARGMREAIGLVADGTIEVSSLITHRFALADAPAAFEALAQRSGLKIVVEPRPADPTPSRPGRSGQRALGRALLARQMLLERASIPVSEAVEHLVALQAQVPIDPYVCLWSRLADFDPSELSRMLEEREAVRGTLLRSTIHLTTSGDFLALRPVILPVVERAFATGSPFGRNLKGLDIEEVLALARELLDERPRTRAELRPLLGERWPDHDRDSLVYAVSYLESVVQVTPRGLWGRSGQPRLARSETWLGRSLDAATVDSLVLRYLGAFGPASVMDAQEWSGLTRLGEVFERLRPGLVVFHDQRGRELFDLPDAPRPDPDTPAPVRFLPQFDNVMLGHADRTRIVSDGVRQRFSTPNA